MIPSIVADEISTGLKEYIRREFPVSNAFFIDEEGQSVVDRFLDRKDEKGRDTSLVKGPWVELKLPFKKADRTCDNFFPNLAGTEFIDSFIPYLHQMKAFERLNSDSPKSTIVATGTGSGKTECFLLPILDYCAKHSGEKGIKAVIIYPMNALAADQEKRLASYIFKIKKSCQVQITAGIYTGDTENHYGASPFKTMTPEHIIKDRNQLCKNPPDILLTNYKMLDYLLVRPDEQSLWATEDQSVCRFIVVDELHTFDGAQGTDLSCLIRRLKDRLGLDQRTACIGTSATLGGGSGVEDLCRFASEVFDVSITPDDGLITEDRLDPEDYLNRFGDCEILGGYPLDSILDVNKSSMLDYIGDVVLTQWFGDIGTEIKELSDFSSINEGYSQEVSPAFSLILGKILPHLDGFRVLIRDLTSPMLLRDLAESWYRRDVGGLSDNFPDDEESGVRVAAAMINSILAMISVARTLNDDPFSVVKTDSSSEKSGNSGLGSASASDLNSEFGSRIREPHQWRLTDIERAVDKKSLLPFLHVRSQLFIRSLVNVVTTVERNPVLYLAADKADITCPLSLPLVSCNSCDQNMWAGVCSNPASSDATIRGNLKDFYDKWFKLDPTVELLVPIKDETEFRKHLELHSDEVYGICPNCRRLFILDNSSYMRDYFEHRQGCPNCGSQEIVAVWNPKLRTTSGSGDFECTVRAEICPHCGARNTLRIMGSRSASLSAVVADMLNGSSFNQDHKIIAFNDSVQDAAFKGGFIASRNYQATVRRAIRNYLYQNAFITGRSVSLIDALKKFIDYWLVTFEKNIKGQTELADAEIMDESARISYISLLKKAEFISTFMPADLQWWRSWKSFTDLSLGSMADFHNALKSDFKKQFEYLYDSVRQRLIFEFWTEITIKSPMVHSLLSSGAVAVTVDPKILKKLKTMLKDIVSELNEEFALQTGPSQLFNLIVGLIYRMIAIGAVDPAGSSGKGGIGTGVIKAPKIENALLSYFRTGNIWLYINGLKSKSILPKYGSKRLPPRGVAIGLKSIQKDDFTELIVGAGKKSWYTRWLFKNLDLDDKRQNILVEDIYKLIFKHLKKAGILGTVERENGDLVWLLPLDSVCLSNVVRTLRCSCCGQKYNFASGLSELLKNSPCFAESCSGTLELEGSFDRSESDTFLSPVRIVEAEHTALISADQREQVEKSFSRNNFSWGVNFLSATPTLEMGIDIGALSSVLLCNVPPSQANFLQRIGRAGRRDGNSIAITMVERSPHDLYYWADPEEMIKGDVRTPGVFLQAVSVLERQLFAFVLGRWISESKANRIPKFLGEVLSNLVAREKDPSFSLFPFDFFVWLQQHGMSLCDEFIAMIEGSAVKSDTDNLSYGDSVESGGNNFRYLNNEKRNYLKDYVLGSLKPDIDFVHDSLEHRLNNLLCRSKASRKTWVEKKDAVKNLIKGLKKKPKDQNILEQLAELESQRNAILKYIDTTFTKMSFFNWLTDKGLLPNYAFPEEGITVDSIVIRRKEYISSDKNADSDLNQGLSSGSDETENSTEDPGQDDAETEVSASESKSRNDNVIKFSFSRSAADSLRALAPNSVFYANGYKLHIDQVMLYDDDSNKSSADSDAGDEKSGKNSTGFGSGVRSSSIEKWRFCPNCSYMQRIDLDENVPDECPQCHCEGFSDVGQVCDMLKIRELVAHADSRKDRITDDRDSREPNLQRRNLFIVALEQDVVNAWETDDEKISFGFEFLKNVSISEVNFGLSTAGKRTLAIGGESIQASGFKICRCCGAVFNERIASRYKSDGTTRRRKKHLHDITCPWYQKEMDEDISHDEKSDPWISGLFLYRQINSEAIRIRLPVSVMLNEKKARQISSSMVAALYLGLEKYFKGNVSHLKICIQSEPDPKHDGETAVYIIIYDTIPGGSGYLKDLMRSCDVVSSEASETNKNCCEKSNNTDSFNVDADVKSELSYGNIIKLLRETANVLKNCKCRETGRDGCYHCVYHYGDNLDRKFISRELAEKIIDQILKSCNNRCRKIPSLKKMKFNLDSFLEEKFFGRLCSARGFFASHNSRKDSTMNCTLNVILSEQGKNNFIKVFPDKYRTFIRVAGKDDVSATNSVKEGDQVFVWQVTFQENLADIFGYGSRPDFGIRPAEGSCLSGLNELTMMVFTDGWTYHGSKNDIDRDTKKRQSILNQKMYVWSITMEDVDDDLIRKTDHTVKRILSDEELKSVKDIKFVAIKEIAFKTFSASRNSSEPDYSVLFKELSENSFRKFLSDNNSRNSFELLLEWLRDPLGFAAQMAVANCYKALSGAEQMNSVLKSLTSGLSVVKGYFRSYFPQVMYSGLCLEDFRKNAWSYKTSEGNAFTGGYRVEFTKNSSCFRASLFVNIDTFPAVEFEQNEKLKTYWRRMLFAANTMQFCGHLWWCTTTNQYDICYDENEI